MANISHSQENATSAGLRVEASREAAQQASAECEVDRLKAKWLRDLSGSDLGEQIGSDAMTAAIRIGDATLIGQICLMALDQYAERMAVRDVFGPDSVEFKDEVMGMALVNDFVRARAGVTQ